MKSGYILSPWRIKIYEHYTINYRVSLDNVVRAQCIRGAFNYSEFWINMNRKDQELVRDGYKLCSCEEEFDKYQLLM